MKTPEIPPPPKAPTGVGTPSAWARAPQWAQGIALVVIALGGGVGTRALFGQGEEQIRQNAKILATLESVVERAKEDRARIEALESRERANYVRGEAADAVQFGALAKQGYQPPREAPEQVRQMRFVPTKNRELPVRPAEQDGRELAIPKPAPPPGLTPGE